MTNGVQTGCEIRVGGDGVRVAGDTVRHSALRLSEAGIEELVNRTQDFSFAYLKELFLSATMQWISTRAVALDPEQRLAPADELSMDEIILEQAALLRSQMTAASSSTLPTGGKLSRALAIFRNRLRS